MNYSSIFAAASLALALVMPLSASADGIGVAVVRNDGTVHTLELSDVNRLEIGESSLYLHHVNGQATEHSYTDVDRVDIGVFVSGISSITQDGSIAVWPTLVETVLNVSGAEASVPVAVFSISGLQAATTNTDAHGNATLDLTSLQAGAYIATIGNHSVKIVKK